MLGVRIGDGGADDATRGEKGSALGDRNGGR